MNITQIKVHAFLHILRRPRFPSTPIYLRPAATGKRAGTKLLETLIAESKAAGVKEIVAVISDKGAEASIALHERFGFKHQGHLAKVGFKFGRWLGTVLMQKSL